MKPQSLTLTNYRAFAGADISLSAVEAAAIVGPNGAGKSTIPEAIIWSLFGEGRSSGVDGVVRLGADEASVQMDYAHNGQVYRVIRKRSRGKKSDLQYLVLDAGDWRPLTGPTIRETQEKIVRDLAMDEGLFLNSSCVLQGKSAGICEATPADRKAVLYRVLEDRLSKFGPLHEAAKATVKGLDSAMSVGRAKRSDLEARIQAKEELLVSRERTECTLAGIRTQLLGAEAHLAELREQDAASKAEGEKLEAVERQISDVTREISQLADQIDNHQRTIDGAQKLLGQAEEIRSACTEATQLEVELEEIGKTAQRYRELGEQYRQKESDIKAAGERLGFEEKRIQGQIDAAEESIRDRERRSALISEVPCSGTAMAGECKLLADARKAGEDLEFWRGELGKFEQEAAAVSEQIRAHADRYSAELEPLKAEALGYNADDHRAKQNRFDSLKSSRDLLPEISAADARVDAANAAIGEARKLVQGKKLQILGLEKDRDELNGRTSTRPDPVAIGLAERSVHDTRGRLDQENRSLAVIEERLVQIELAENELTEISAGLEDQERQRTIYATLQDAFSRDGIPALIIDAAIPQIEEHANEILASLSDGRMNLRFVTQKAKATGGIAETLDIIVSDSAGERAYEDWSGGEKLRIDLSVRIALGQVLAQRTGARIETLILDEVCAPLDEAGEEALLDCIQRLQASFGCILLITHRESLKDRLPQQIVVTKNGAGSEARLVA